MCLMPPLLLVCHVYFTHGACANVLCFCVHTDWLMKQSELLGVLVPWLHRPRTAALAPWADEGSRCVADVPIEAQTLAENSLPYL